MSLCAAIITLENLLNYSLDFFTLAIVVMCFFLQSEPSFSLLFINTVIDRSNMCVYLIFKASGSDNSDYSASANNGLASTSIANEIDIATIYISVSFF